MSKIILHIDMNAYFATVEEILDPSLKGKPVVVGGKGSRSVVSTANYEARKYGINSAMPTMSAKKLCRNLIVIEGHYDKYLEFRDRFLKIISEYSKAIQVASIDECYVDFTEYVQTHDPKKTLDYVKEIQSRIYNEIGLKCSIGVSVNTFLAKMGSDYKKPMGITIIRLKDVKEIIHPLPIKDMYGIGKKTAPRLESIGIKTIGDLANSNKDDYNLKNILGKNTAYMIDLANGIGSDTLVLEREDNKSLGNTITLPFNSQDEEVLLKYLKSCLKNISDRAKEANLITHNVAITIKYHDFKVINRSLMMDDYTNDYHQILPYIIRLFNSNYNGEMVRLIGCSLNNLKKIGDVYIQETLNLDTHMEVKSDDKTLKVIEEINKKYNKEIVRKGEKY